MSLVYVEKVQLSIKGMEIAASRGVPNNKNAQKDTKIRANQKTQDHIEIKGKF